MVDDEQFQSVQGWHDYFSRLLELLHDNPAEGLNAFARDKPRVIALLEGKGLKFKLLTKQLEKIEPGKHTLTIDEIHLLRSIVEEVRFLTKPEELELAISKIKKEIKEPQLQQRLDHLLSILLRFPNEVKLFQGLVTRAEALEQQWNSTIADPLPEVKKLYEELNSLPKRLKNEYGDQGVASIIEKELQQETYRLPVPQITPIKHLLQRIYTRLSQADVFSQRFIRVKEEVTQDLQEEITTLEHSISKEANHLAQLLSKYSEQLEIPYGAANEAIEANLEVRDELIRALTILGREIILCEEMLAIAKKDPVDSKAIQAKTAEYLKLLDEEEAVEKALRKKGKSAQFYTEIMESAFNKAA